MENPYVSSSSSVPVKRHSGVVKWALVIGIAIVINLFLTYLVRVIYHEPEFEGFCPEEQVNEAIETKDECLQVGGQWNENVDAKRPMIQGETPQPIGYCNPNFTCSRNYEEAAKVYNRNVFIVFVTVGILLLVASVFLSGVEAISLGLSFGGVLALVVGSMWYWSDMNDILRVIVLGAALLGLLFVTWKKFRNE